MKTAFIFLSMILTSLIYAEEKDQTALIAKGIQCSYLREKSFQEIYELYTANKKSSENIKKISDSIDALAFKVCDPENSTNADKEILTVCIKGCDQFMIKAFPGTISTLISDGEKCKKVCLHYSNLLDINYTSATKALRKNLEMNPLLPKNRESLDSPSVMQIMPAVPVTTVLEKDGTIHD